MEVNRIDNAWHDTIFPQYVEWWYLDAALNTGYYLAGSFGIWGNVQRPSSLVIRSDFLLTTPNGAVIDFGKKVALSAFQASSNKCEVNLGKSYLRDNDDHYLLHLDIEDNVSLDLAFIPECDGFKYVHFIDRDSSRCFSWVVPMPRAVVQGTLRHKGEHVSLVGVGYHDHNWASVSLAEELRAWKWGHLHGDDATVVFASVEGNHGALFSGMAWIAHKKTAYDYRYLHFDNLAPDVILEQKPSGWNLSVIDKNISLQLDLEKVKTLLELGDDTGYKRYLSYARGEILDRNHHFALSGNMIHELKQISSNIT
jgi:hypothetical protein